MTTWIGHLRIAEELLTRIEGLEETAFTFGSLAPDSGIPNADWTQFDPPKDISHYLASNIDGESGVEDLRFYRENLSALDPGANRELYSFLLGYYIHLFSDRMWTLKVGIPSRQAYPNLFTVHSENDAFNLLKEDWYGLDQRFVRDHPRSLFWRVFLNAPIPASPLSFIRQEAFEHQVRYIREFYSQPRPEWVLDRPYPYLNETSMSAYINQVATLVLKLLPTLSSQTSDSFLSAVELLSPEETSPLPLPLGDTLSHTN